MIVVKKVLVELPELKQYADYGSIKHELDVIIRYSKIAEIIEDRSEDDAYQLDALATAALVKYSRIFKSGVREKISHMSIGFNDEELEAHEYLINLRDKHISHSVNGYERGQVVAFLEIEKNKEIRVSGITTESSRVLMTKKNIWCIGELAKKTRDFIDNFLIERYQDNFELVYKMSQESLKDLKEPQDLQVEHTAVAVARKSK